MLLIIIYKDSGKVKIYWKLCIKIQSISVLLDIAKSAGEKMLMSVELKGFVTWFIYFLDLPWVRYNCGNFHHCRICVTDFRVEGTFCSPPLPPILEQPRKKPIEVSLKLMENAFYITSEALFILKTTKTTKRFD